MFGTRKTDKGEVLSAGYPAVEALIDSEDFEPINQAFGEAYTQLEVQTKKKEAKLAMKAIDRVMGLFKELLAIKYEIQRRQKK